MKTLSELRLIASSTSVLFASLLLIFPGSSSAVEKILDGKAKQLNVVHHWSWGLQHSATSGLKTTGISYLEVKTNDLAACTVDDDLKLFNGPLNWANLTFPAGSVVFGDMCLLPPGAQEKDQAVFEKTLRKNEVMLEAIKARGAKWAFLHTTHHRWHRYRELHGKDGGGGWKPNPLNHKLVEKLNERAGAIVAIDTWTPMEAVFPFGVKGDLEHLTEVGKVVYAREWIGALYRHDGLPVPQSLQKEVDKALAEEKAKRARIAITFTPPPASKPLRIGDEIKIDLKASTLNFYGGDGPRLFAIVMMGYIRGTLGTFVLKDSIPGTLTGSYTLTIPDSAKVLNNAPSGLRNKFPLHVDSAAIAIRGLGSMANYEITPTFRLALRDGSFPNTGSPEPVSLRRPALRIESGARRIEGMQGLLRFGGFDAAGRSIGR